MKSISIPEEIIESYSISESATIVELSGGLVNTTYLLSDAEQDSILQRLSPVFNQNLIHDTRIASDYMLKKGWEAPVLLPIKNGEFSVLDATHALWRRQAFIASDSPPTEFDNPVLAQQMIHLLGKWHYDIGSLEYKPKFELAGFHDTPFHARKLGSYLLDLPDKQASLAYDAITQLRNVSSITDEHIQLIHGDPKLDNMLFRSGKPFTLIDYDTIMCGSPWIDVGDMLRSILGKRLETNPMSVHEASELMDVYRDANQSTKSRDQLLELAAQATGRIALELGIRYLCDIIDDRYFAWDNKVFSSRSQNHTDRALRQFHVANSALGFLN